MKLLAVSYATPEYRGVQRLNALTARRAGFDQVRALGPEDLGEGFRRRNAEVLGLPRGGGYWLWKPYVVLESLRGLADGDLVFYSDSGAHFVAPVAPMVAAFAAHRGDLLILGEGGVEEHYTHRVALARMGCEAACYTSTPQRYASFFLVRRSTWSLRFFEDCLRWCEDPEVLLDRPPGASPPDPAGFVAHRHDQSVFSLLTKLHEVDVPVTPFVEEDLVPESGQIVQHTRGRVRVGRAAAVLMARGFLDTGDLGELVREGA